MKAIYSDRGDGLGTRMLAAIYGRILAGLLDLPSMTFWPPLGGADVYAGYSLMHPDHLLEIFASKNLFTDADDDLHGRILFRGEVGNVNLKGLYHSQSELSGLSREQLLAVLNDFDGLLYDFPGPLLDFMSTEIDLKRACIDVWSKVNWSDAVRRGVDAIDAEIDLSTCIAAHVRRGDLLDLVNRVDLEQMIVGGFLQMVLQRYTPVDAFFQQIDTSGSIGGILVCTEDLDVVQRFRDRYGMARVATSMSLDLTENQRAATDLLLLSRAKQIVAPALSFFSTCAAAVSEVQLRNAAWHLETSIEEITSLMDKADPERVRQVSAIMNAAAYQLVIQGDSDLGNKFRSKSLSIDKEIFYRVNG